jgi:uncharacterized protein YkwD
MLCVPALVAVFSGCQAQQQRAELAIYASINAMRADAGLPPLQPDARLVEIADARSTDMAANGYFGHVPPNGCDYACLMDQHGIAHRHAAETIAWNTHDWTQTTQVAIGAWTASPPHRAKLLDCHYQRFGAGVALAADGKIYFTAIFEGAATC